MIEPGLYGIKPHSFVWIVDFTDLPSDISTLVPMEINDLLTIAVDVDEFFHFHGCVFKEIFFKEKKMFIAYGYLDRLVQVCSASDAVI